MDGSRRDFSAGALRALLSIAEPFYAGAMRARNGLYDAGVFRSHDLQRPVICVGNLTAGGTGKTPMVRWLAGRLRAVGLRVAVLSRGYKAANGTLGDEQLMLDRMLNGAGELPIFFKANSDRVMSAKAVLEAEPSIDLFLLDDGFQHRRVRRQMDIVLLSATDPFGFGHVLPRGLLREPVRGLRRANAVVITHADELPPGALDGIMRDVRQIHPAVPIHLATHKPVGLRSPMQSPDQPADRSFDDLNDRRFFGFCGIANPQSFERQLRSLAGECVGVRFFADHYAYTTADVEAIRAEAVKIGASIILTTEKDWVKVSELPGANAAGPEIWRIDVAMRFLDGGDEALFQQVFNRYTESRKR